jgi:tRNA pseudouridine38-40 synthase
MSLPPERVHRLCIAYDGSAYQGWQRQGELPTVQLEMERAAAKIWGTAPSVQGSGRTDTGVHALGQVASFLAPVKIPDPLRLRMAFNDHLPSSVRVTGNDLGPDSFHARFSSIGKEYHYRIINREILLPHDVGRAWHVPRPLDRDSMGEALQCLHGRHDFSSFASNPGYERTTMVRSMIDCRLWERDGDVRIKFHADGFLYRMVRNLVGALVKVGLGKMSPLDYQRILEARSRQAAPNTAPADGLYLMRVYYPEDLAPSFAQTPTLPPWP